MPLVASVVIPTYNRSERLSGLLDALVAQEGVDSFEVILVDDASSDDTQAILAGRASDLPFELVALRQDRNAGPAAARNRGWRAARGPIVCFTDDDCSPTPKWLSSVLARFDEADMVQGQTIPNPDQAHRHGPFSRTIHMDWEQGHYETCNMAYRRDLLERLAGFDETFPYYAEDTDLAWRAKKSGARSAFAPDALVYHEISTSDWMSAWREVPRRQGRVQLFKKHPGLRSELGHGVFFERTHLPAMAVAVGAAALAVRPRSPLRWAVASGLGLWYAWNVQYTTHKPKAMWQWAIVVPLAYLLDVKEVAVMIRASVKYRTLEL
jgi:GT2 family glycosyltransferase